MPGMPPDSSGISPEGTRAQRWLARLSFALAFLAVAVVLLFAGVKSAAMLGVGMAAAAVSLATAFLVLSRRGVLRWLSLAAFVLAPLTVIVVYAFADLLWVALASAAGWLLACAAGRAALTADMPDWRMPEFPAAPARQPFLIMNPRSGGGKVAKFDLQRKAEALGAEVFLMSGAAPVDVAEVARKAVAAGSDLLGVAGGDGTQALVAGVAAEHGIPFMVITAGTRNHFALDLGLDRADPAACLRALSDGVELHVDLGVIGGRTFVNNASFGAYAEVVETPAYRDDKLGTTLDTLPDLLHGHRGTRLSALADGVPIDGPQALLVACNPYGTGDIAGLGRRARLDRGVLGVVAVTVDSVRQAVGLLRGRHTDGLRVLTARTVEVTAGSDRIPVGVDGESILLPVPVRCAIRPAALRVRVPRNRPGVPAPKPVLSWSRLRRLASWRRRPPSASPAAGYRPAGAGHPGETRQEPDASRLRAARRPGRRAGPGQGAVGADDDLRRGTAGRVVGQWPGVARPRDSGDRLGTGPGTRAARARIRHQLSPPAVGDPHGPGRRGDVPRLGREAAANSAVPNSSPAGRGDRRPGRHRWPARPPPRLHVPALEPAAGRPAAGATAHAGPRPAGQAAVLPRQAPSGLTQPLAVAHHSRRGSGRPGGSAARVSPWPGGCPARPRAVRWMVRPLTGGPRP
jgi:diacylglycerol kinase family enzyme